MVEYLLYLNKEYQDLMFFFSGLGVTIGITGHREYSTIY